MSPDATVDALFEMAIAIERSAETLYRGLQAKFAHIPEVAAFWEMYANEETGHASYLESIRAELSAEQRAHPADPQVLQDARKMMAFSVEHGLNRIGTLEDAYQIAYEIETSETNTIFEFLITNYTLAQKSRAFLQRQLHQHIDKITAEFPTPYRDAERRRAVTAEG